MKRSFRLLVVVVVMMFVYVGCAKLPQQEIDNAKAAVEAAIQAGASTYTPDELKTLNDDYAAAVEEANKVAGKLFKGTTEIKDKLVKIKEAADALATTAAAKKEEAKTNALTAQTEAQTALTEAKGLVEQAPVGKGSMADIEAFKADLAALDEALPDIQKAIDGEDFLGAVEKANGVKEKAAGISEQIKKAIEEMAAKKGKKK